MSYPKYNGDGINTGTRTAPKAEISELAKYYPELEALCEEPLPPPYQKHYPDDDFPPMDGTTPEEQNGLADKPGNHTKPNSVDDAKSIQSLKEKVAKEDNGDISSDHGEKEGKNEEEEGGDDSDSDDSEEPEKPEVNWSQVWYDYTQYTTFHGLSRVTDDTPFVLRRIIWVFLVIGGITLFLIQATNSVQQYFSRPVSVNMRIMHEKELRFPTITLCNQNVFKATKAFQHNYYRLIDDMFSDRKKLTDLSKYNATDVGFEELYKATEHTKEDMIISCKWNEQECSSEDFIRTVTDHGVCFSFNTGHTQDGEIKNATQTGTGKGLSVLLNIEQYEYMRGPNTGSGVKILAHDYKEIPLVREMGQAIPPASRAFVSLEMMRFVNLKAPYGTCETDKDIKYFKEYTIPACALSCKESFLVKNCDCMEVYMHEDRAGFPPKCTLKQRQDCVHGVLERFSRNTDRICECPLPCLRTAYESSITYGGAPSYRGKDILSEEKLKHLKKNYRLAMETQQKVDSVIRERDQQIVYKLKNFTDNFEVLFDEMDQKMMNATDIVAKFYHLFKARIEFHLKHGLRAVRRGLENGFVDAWDVLEKTKLESVSSDSIEIMRRIYASINKINNTDNKETRANILWDIELDMTSKHHMAQEAIVAMHDIGMAFREGKAVDELNITFHRRYDTTLQLVPTRILKFIKDNYETYVTKIEEELEKIKVYTIKIKDIAKKVNLNRRPRDKTLSEKFEKDFEEVKKQYIAANNNFHRRYLRFRNGVVYECLDDIDKRQSTMIKLREVLDKETSDLRLTLMNNSRTLLREIKEEDWPGIKVLIADSVGYISSPKALNKSRIAARVKNSPNIQGLRKKFDGLRARALNFQYDWPKFKDALIKVWLFIREEDSTLDFYELLYRDFEEIVNNGTEAEKLKVILQAVNITDKEPIVKQNWEHMSKVMNSDIGKLNKTSFKNEMNNYFDDYMTQFNLAEALGDKDSKFLETLEQWEKLLLDFQSSYSVDKSFFGDNFLEIDVYFKDLHFQEVEQQIGYDETNLWSDIGGSMGLFVGASVLTICELLDAILHNFLKVKVEQKKQIKEMETKKKEKERKAKKEKKALRKFNEPKDDVIDVEPEDV